MRAEYSAQLVFPRLVKDLPDVYGKGKFISVLTETNHRVQSPVRHRHASCTNSHHNSF